MRAAIFNEPRSITAGDRRDPAIVEPTDAIVRVVPACVCGDFVIAPFAFSDGTCPNCRNGITTACTTGGFYPSNGDGGQGEAVRVPLADSTLVTVPGSGHSDEQLRSLLTLSDVMATGHHAAVCAQVEPGATVAVVGDGAVGERGDAAIEAVKELTAGVGVDATLECVGTGQSMQTAIAIARAGSMVGYVGVPHGVELPIAQMFGHNVGVRGGAAPARVYIPELLDDVLEGRIDPGRVLDYETDLDGIADAYAAMDERRAIKSLVRVGTL